MGLPRSALERDYPELHESVHSGSDFIGIGY
jgi:hypothetical protein